MYTYMWVYTDPRRPKDQVIVYLLKYHPTSTSGRYSAADDSTLIERRYTKTASV